MCDMIPSGVLFGKGEAALKRGTETRPGAAGLRRAGRHFRIFPEYYQLLPKS